MDKKATSAALERLEGVAAEFLETEIAGVEKEIGVAIKDVDVVVLPDQRGGGPGRDCGGQYLAWVFGWIQSAP